MMEWKKDFREQIKELFNNKIFLWIISITIPFSNMAYKIFIAQKFNVPTKYFQINFIEVIFYQIILATLLILYLTISSKSLKFILLLLLLSFEIQFLLKEQFFLLIAIYTLFSFLFFCLVKIEKSLKKYRKLGKYFRINKKIRGYLKNYKKIEQDLKNYEKDKKLEKYLKNHNKLREYLKDEKKIQRYSIIKKVIKWSIRIIYIILLSLIFIVLKEFIFKEYQYYLFSKNKIMWFLFIPIIGIIFFYFYDKENEKSNLENKYSLLDIVYVLNILFYIFVILLKFILMETNYEILYKDDKSNVVITTYEGKYLVMDYDIDEVNELIIYTKKYEFIEINDVEYIEYKNFRDVKIKDVYKFKELIQLPIIINDENYFMFLIKKTK